MGIPRRGEPAGSLGAGERRLLTVLFCDLCDFSHLTTSLDPEDLRVVILAFRELCGAAIDQAGGILAQFQGDGVLAYFGYPRAREDDAARAVRAGLGIQMGIGGLGRGLAARVGIHTGLAVVGDLGKGLHADPAAAVGETTTIASRLQNFAKPGEVLISKATRMFTEGRFRMSEVVSLTLKGIDRPVDASVVQEELPRGSYRLPASPTGDGAQLPPVVGREGELRSLCAAWRDVEAGAGAVIAIEGAPGFGKSRLVGEFLARVGPQHHHAVVLACAADDSATAFHPVVAWLNWRLGRVSGQGAKHEALAALVAEAGLAHEHLAPLAALLDCATPDDERDLAAAPRRRRRRTMEAQLALLLGGPKSALPLVLVAEDVHWADDSTLGLLRLLAERCKAGTARALLLLTSRPGSRALQVIAPLTIALGPLQPDDARELAKALLPPGLPESALSQVVARADGVPFYIEEMARAAVAGGSEITIPLTLRGALMAQLDALDDAKPIAQIAAVLGRSFQTALFEALFEESQVRDVHRGLRRLVEARFLEPEGSGEESEGYSFRHALIRDAAYDSLLRTARRRHHAHIAAVLRERFPDMAATRPELLAQHLAHGGLSADAVAAYEAAARRAAQRSAHEEAAEHCRAALRVLAQQAPSRARTEAELLFEVMLAAQLTIARGNAEPDVLRAFQRGHQAATELGEPRMIVRTLRGQQTFHLVHGDIAAGHAISERVLKLIDDAGDDVGLQLQALRAHGLTLLYLARFDEARDALRKCISLYDPVRDAPQRFEYGSDAMVLARAHLGWTEWHLGNAAAAAEESRLALSAARMLDHPHSLAFALAFDACLHQFAAAPANALAAAQALESIARQHDFAYWIAWAEILGGWAAASLDDRHNGEGQLRRGLDDYARTGAGLLLPYARYLLADVVRVDRSHEALALLDQSLREADLRSIRIFRQAAYKLRGTIVATG